MAADSRGIPSAIPPSGGSAGVGPYFGTLTGILAAFGILCMALLLYARQQGALPPPPLTTEQSFNEKAQFVRSLRGANAEMIVAGSSLSLNDLSSGALLQPIPGNPSLVNIAAFGMRISETRLWLNHVIGDLGKPRLVLICLSPLDFRPVDGWYAPADGNLDAYLEGKGLPLFAVKNFSLVNYLKLARHMKEFRTSRGTYASLDFDRDGSIPLDISYPNVDAVRWNYVPEYDKIEEFQYDELNRLAAQMASERISLVCVLPPMRHAARVAENHSQAAAYQARVAEILRKNGQTLLDLETGLDLGDSYFADGIHLNARGAQVFSEELGRDLASAAPWSTNTPLH